MKKGWFRLHLRKSYRGGESLEQRACQRTSGCGITENVQGKPGWGFKQHGVVEGVLPMTGTSEKDDPIQRSHPNQAIEKNS